MAPKAKAKKRAVGRPSKFDAINLDQVRKVATRGWTDAEMADFFGISVSNWNEWKLKHPEFQESLKDWKIEADSRVERCLYERATGYSHKEDKIFQYEGMPVVVPTVKHYPPDTPAGIFWLKNRQPDKWRDKQELSIPEGVVVKQLVVRAASETKGV